VLILLAVAHGITIAILARIRDRQMQDQLAEEMQPIQRPEPIIEPTVQRTTEPPFLHP